MGKTLGMNYPNEIIQERPQGSENLNGPTTVRFVAVFAVNSKDSGAFRLYNGLGEHGAGWVDLGSGAFLEFYKDNKVVPVTSTGWPQDNTCWFVWYVADKEYRFKTEHGFGVIHPDLNRIAKLQKAFPKYAIQLR